MNNEVFTLCFSDYVIGFKSCCDIIDRTCNLFEYDTENKCCYVTYYDYDTATDAYDAITDILITAEQLEQNYVNNCKE